MGFLLKLLTQAAGLALAAFILEDIYVNGAAEGMPEFEEKVLPILGVALILTVVNVVVRPILKLVTLPIVLLTMGLFLLVINAGMLLLTGAFAREIGLGFHVDGFLAAVIGSMLVTAGAWTADAILGNE